MTSAKNKIAFQGEPGAYSHLACRAAYPHMTPLPCQTFEAAFASVTKGKAALAMIPIENSVAGRVADIHHLMPNSGLFIVAEHFQPVRHCLLAPRGASLKTVRTVHSHVQALDQNRALIRELGLKSIVEADTAGAARLVAERNDATQAAIASDLAAELNGLKILRPAAQTMTRFLLLAKKMQKPAIPKGGSRGVILTTFVFTVRNVPAALYKVLGGFATNDVNLVKLESYMLGGSFAATQFYTDIEGHPDEPSVKHAFDELSFFTATKKILGVYPAHPFRRERRKQLLR
jgi:prephenate dehydratase